MRSASCFLSWPARPDSPRIDSASLFCNCASSWSISSSGKSLGALDLVFFVVVMVSIMVVSFRYHLMTFTHKKTDRLRTSLTAPFCP